MKHRITLLAAACAALAHAAPLTLRWTAEASDPKPYEAQIMRGETVALQATLRAYGQPVDLTGATATLYWQTNGMASAWWTAPATAISNTLTAAWTPANDAGATRYTFFLGAADPDGATLYRAYGTLAMRPSPGVSPADLPPPDILGTYATKDWVSDQHYLTAYTETDPTVPAWAKAPAKPAYTPREVGAWPFDYAYSPGVILNSYLYKNDLVMAFAPTATLPTEIYFKKGAAEETVAYQSWVTSTIPAWALDPTPPASGVTAVNGQTGAVDIFGSAIKATKNLAASGVAITGATSGSGNTGSLIATLGPSASATGERGVAVGYAAAVHGLRSVAVGPSAAASAATSIAVGVGASASGSGVALISIGSSAVASGSPHNIQLGTGTNASATPVFQIWSWPLLDRTTGKIPADRLEGVVKTVNGAAPDATGNVTATKAEIVESFLDITDGETLFRVDSADGTKVDLMWKNDAVRFDATVPTTSSIITYDPSSINGRLILIMPDGSQWFIPAEKL